MHQAREAGAEQAVLHRVSGGFLKGESLAWHHTEAPHPKLPQVLEIVASEELLQMFLDLNGHVLKGVRVVILRGEEIVIDQMAREGQIPNEQMLDDAQGTPGS